MPPVNFSTRTNWPLDSNPLIQRLEALRRRNVPLIDLTESNPTRCHFPYPAKDILQNLSKAKNLLYEPSSAGMLKARQAVADYYDRKGYRIHPQQIILTSSTSEAYAFLFRLLLNVDDAVLIGQPSYPLFQCLLELNDARADFYPLLYNKSRWYIDMAALENCIGPKTKSIILVNPNNPTGSYLNLEELHILNQLCRKHHLSLICDEVFADFAFLSNPSRVCSLVSNNDVLTFSLGGISKSLALPQMKLGWIILSGPDEQVKNAFGRLEIIADAYLSVNTPSQNALSEWFGFQNKIQGAIRQRTKNNLTYLKETALTNTEIEYFEIEGGWYGILRLPATYSEGDWVIQLLEKDYVFVHPGYFFDFKEEPYIVVSLLPEEKIFQEGIIRILNRIKHQ